MAIKQFKRLLDLMANSIYTNKDIFLRELISNASDALDKKHYLSLTDTSITEVDPNIHIEVDEENRIITIEDNGIGMNEDDLNNNLGTIAKSGSLDFKQLNENMQDVDIIGQFGVGFYSAFMVADRIEVTTKKVGEDKAYTWLSESEEGYEINEAVKENAGSIIKLHIKEDTEDFDYSKYLDKNNLQMLIKKYSDYIRYPITMRVEVVKAAEEEGKTETTIELKTINSMVPIWKRDKKDISQEEYDEYYMQQSYDYNKPLKTIHYKVEGNTSYTALLYIPSVAPYNYYTTDYKTGLKLYSKSVFIKDEADELISDYFHFVRGLVDSDDLNLNISREILQQDHQMANLKKSIDKKIKSTLEKMLKNEREDYEKFFEAFGVQLKFGAYENYGVNRDVLYDLLIFKSSYEDKYTTLREYVERMQEGQEEIYYAVGDSIDKIKEMPQIERVLDKGYEVLYFLDNVDEFMASMLMNYDGHAYKSINKGDLDLDSEEEKEKTKQANDDNKDILGTIKTALDGKVTEVKLSNRLKSHPVCLVSDDNISLEMEKVMAEMNPGQAIKANRILEINPDHELFQSLKAKFDNKQNIDEYANVLYDQALLIAGLDIEDPMEYSRRITKLMIDAMK